MNTTEKVIDKKELAEKVIGVIERDLKEIKDALKADILNDRGLQNLSIRLVCADTEIEDALSVTHDSRYKNK